VDERFDAYFKWLGIPPAEQPPNYYRLLGIPLFVDDVEVISHAADRLMAQIRTFQTGPHSALSQKILNEISRARITLLKTHTKAEYDRRLQAESSATVQPLQPVRQPAPPASQSYQPLFPPREQAVGSIAPQPVRVAPVPLVSPTNPLATSATENGIDGQPKRSHRSFARPSAPTWITRIPAHLRTWVVALFLLLIGALSASMIRRSPSPQPPSEPTNQQDQQVAGAVGEAKAWLQSGRIDDATAFASTLNDALADPNVSVSLKEEIRSLLANLQSRQHEINRARQASAQAVQRAQAWLTDGALADSDGVQGALRAVLDQPLVADNIKTSARSLLSAIDARKTSLLDTGRPSPGTRAGQEWNGNGLKVKFCWCPAGRFTMGSPAGEKNRGSNEGQVQVELTQGFWLGKYEVTQREWESVMSSSPWKAQTFVREGTDYPASYVSWNDAGAFCRQFTIQEREAGRLPADWEYRLPTEAQWEYACRAGTTTAYSFGSSEEQLPAYAWFDKNAYDLGERYAHRVGQKLPNAWGLCDLHGNVWEWCRDWYVPQLPGGADPEVTSGTSDCVFRGCCWNYIARVCRSACRGSHSPKDRDYSMGLRMALQQTHVQETVHPAASKPIERSNSVPPKAVIPSGSASAAVESPESGRSADAFAGTRAGQEWDGNGMKVKFCWCPAGRFTMGSPAGEKNRGSNEGQVQVELTQGFWLGKYEVTQREWESVMSSRPWRAETSREGNDYPASYVSWNEAEAFCRQLTEQERQAGRLPSDWEYRLPTEAQWEYACRAASTMAYCFGNSESQLPSYAWYGKNARDVGEDYAHRVGQKLPNVWGLCDLHGNVWEWCRDLYVPQLPGGADPDVTSGASNRVVRGGSWRGSTADCRSSYRVWFAPDSRRDKMGFRLALQQSRVPG